ncbi:MAG: prepilin-type N-terminal cleavage/methylation domain-containing protein [Opitutaceae bacterium]|nr:prepilin-type N-terminal cleavage/methylation domain-containing protein [Opitutaceae bacterium]
MNTSKHTASSSRCIRSGRHSTAADVGAFTLIELLTVIAIIGILAAIIIPTVGKVRQTALRAQCASNLRQDGIAILGFALDNNDYLPGGRNTGLLGGVSPQFEAGANTYALVTWLAPWLVGNLPAETGQKVRVETLVCPARHRAKPVVDTQNSYLCNNGASLAGTGSGTKVRPFGYSDQKQLPYRLADFAATSRTALLFDLDNAIWKRLGATGDAPDDPVHGNVRNFLFADGHVAAITGDDYAPLVNVKN